MVNMEIIISAVDRASQVLENVQRKMEVIKDKTARVAETFSKVGQGLAVAGAGMTAFATPFVLGMSSAIRTGMEFEKAMYKIKAITGATDEEFKQLEGTARQLGATTAYSASEAAEAMYLMASAGLKTEEVTASVNNVLKLATVAQTDLATTTDLVISTLNSFGMSAQESSRAVDVFVQACANSPATVEKLQYSLKYAAPAARALGLSLEDTVAGLMMFYKAGRKGEEAGTALRQVLVGLANLKVQRALEQYGIKVMDASGKLRNLGDVLEDIKKKGLSATEIYKIFGTEAGTAIQTLLDQGGSAYEGYVDILNNSAGVTEQKYGEMTNTVWNKIQTLKSQIEDIKIEIFKDSKGNIKEFLDMLIKSMPAIKEFAVSVAQGMGTVGKVILAVVVPMLKAFQALPAPVKKAIGVFVGLAAAVAAIVGPILLVVGGLAMMIAPIIEVVSAVGGLGAAFGAIVGAISTAITAIGALLLAIDPIVWIILAIIAVIGALYLAWKNNWLGIRDITASIVQTVKEKIAGFIEVIKWLIGQIIEHQDLIKDALITALLGPFAPIKAAWDTNLFGIRDRLTEVFNNIVEYLNSQPQRFYDAGVGMITELKKGIESKIEEVKQSILDLLNWIDDHLPHSPAKEGPLSRLDKVGPGFVETIAEGIDKHKSKIQNVVGGLTTTMAIKPQLSGAPTTSNILNYGGDTQTNYNVAINVVGRGYDEQQLAQKISNILKKQQYR
jgi:TP901 family phage tail tape measure protein